MDNYYMPFGTYIYTVYQTIMMWQEPAAAGSLPVGTDKLMTTDFKLLFGVSDKELLPFIRTINTGTQT